MNNYKTYQKVSIGYSDIASIIVRSIAKEDGKCIGVRSTEIGFGGDGDYKAYIVDEKCEIPSHYELVEDNLYHWLDVFDDEKRTFRAPFARQYKIYRAGVYGIIIQVLHRQ